MFRRTLARLRTLPQYENNILVLTAIGVGVSAGLGAIVLEFLLRWVSTAILGGDDVTEVTGWQVLFGPAIGALLAGPLVARFAREAKGHGVPEVMAAVALRGGRIRGRVAVVKTVASALTIGSGGSAGREGPIVQVGSALGSRIAQLMKMSESRTRTLVACGAAGAIAAAFNAPLAGVFFALEVILQRFTSRGFATVVLSAVTASVVWRTAFGNRPVIDVPEFGLRSPVELIFYVGLGLAAALVALLFVRILSWTEGVFDSWRFIDDLKPFVGAIALGGLGWAVMQVADGPLVYGNGLPGINLALSNTLTWKLLLVLLVAKLLATVLTLGPGGSGGVFAPSLFMGAMLGGAVGKLVNAWLPASTANPAAYSMVGMAAVFAAAAQAPISSILILFEMTNDYRIMLPLMLCVGVATAVFSAMSEHSIYTEKLAKRGIELRSGREQHLMERTSVRRALVDSYPKLSWPATRSDVVAALDGATLELVIVVEPSGILLGGISTAALRAWLDGPDEDLASLLDHGVPAVLASESLEAAFQRIAPRGAQVAPVVEGSWSRKVVGVVTRQSLLGAYWSALSRQSS